MAGSPQILASITHQLEGGNQPYSYNVDNSPNALPFSTLNNQIAPFEPLNERQGLMLSPSHSGNGVIGDTPTSSCRFRCEVLDDCAKARFYARALEFYLLDNEGTDLSCLFAGCPAQNFKNSTDMLRHLKCCSCFDKGVFRCPLCNRYESFRVQSSSQCRWGKKPRGHKLKDMFRGFTGNQKVVHNGLSYQRSAPPEKHSMQGASCAIESLGVYSVQSTTPEIIPDQTGLGMLDNRLCELEEAFVPSELSGDSPINHQSRSEYNSTCGGSEMSSAVVTPDGSIVNPNISPGSSHCEEIPVTTCCHNSSSIPIHRLTELCGDSNSRTGIENECSISLYESISTSHSLGPVNSFGAGALIGSANLSTTCTPHISPPKLRLETSPSMLNYTTPALDLEVSLYRSQPVDCPVITEIQTAAYPSTSVAHSQPSGASIINALSLGEDLFRAQSFPDSSIDTSPFESSFLIPDSQPTSPSSSPSEQEIECLRCTYRPSGEPGGRKANLRKHEKNMHTKRPLIPCSHCGTTFTRHDNMVAHCRKKHSTSPSKRRRGSSTVSSPSQPKRKGSEHTF
ncbi:hypothetical protein F4679DRAFT_585767 [Xylaria curta]|nr:hypothetical protein F4679DRAFT_585767 [Xylaria curta]